MSLSFTTFQTDKVAHKFSSPHRNAKGPLSEFPSFHDNLPSFHQQGKANPPLKEYFLRKEVEPQKPQAQRLAQEEQMILEEISRSHKLDDPLQLWIGYLKWVEENYSGNEQKYFEVLQNLVKTMSGDDRYKQDSRYVEKWLAYLERCIDQVEILSFMEDNDIGTELAIFYRAYAIHFERQRDFITASDILLQGRKVKAKPIEKMDKTILEFEDRMKNRLIRDFHSKNQFLTDDEKKSVKHYPSNKPVRWSLLQQKPKDQPGNSNMSNGMGKTSKEKQGMISAMGEAGRKRKQPYHDGFEVAGGAQQGQTSMGPTLKKVKLTEISNTVQCGANFAIYVDEQFRSIIPESLRLVHEYEMLCAKFKFSLSPGKAEGGKMRWYSWIREEMTAEEQAGIRDAFRMEARGKGEEQDISKQMDGLTKKDMLKMVST